MKTYANTGRMKKAGPTLTPDGKTLVDGKCERAEQLRRDLDTLLAGPERLELEAFGFTLARNLPEAEELVQAACFKALRCAAIYDPRRPLMAWLKTILRNAFCDGRRHSRLTVSLDVDAEDGGGDTFGDLLAAPDLPADVRMEREGESAVLMRALAELPAQVRRIVALRDFEGMTYEATAARLRIPLGTVRSSLWRGHRVLCEMVHASDLPLPRYGAR